MLVDFGILVKILQKYGFLFVNGLMGTLWISLVVVAIGSIFGILVALMRMGKIKVLSVIASAYIEIIRGTPMLLQLYLFWLGLPKLFNMPDMNETLCIIVALVFSTGAYTAEIIRAGIGAVDIGQWEAARSIGLSEKNMMVRIIMPQAIKNILPALGNEFISTIKGTSLASTFFIAELMTSFKTVQSATFRALEPLIIVGVIYFVLTFSLSRLLKLFETRLKASD